MLPVITPAVNRMIQDAQGNLSTFPYPANIAGTMPKEMRQKVMKWMLETYIWPQAQERKPYEQQWDKLLEMSRATLKYREVPMTEGERIEERRRELILNGDTKSTLSERIEIADTMIFDTVDRMTNMNHFIAFKEAFPARYEVPEDMVFPYENEAYSPSSAMVKSANCWLRFNVFNQDVYRKGWMAARHHYTYGFSIVDSQFTQKIQPVPRRLPNKTFENRLELVEIGITFEPISLRKLWLNPRLPIYKMDYQPCPFFFEEVPRFAIVANQYDADMNPFGFSNTEQIQKAEYLVGTELAQSWLSAMDKGYEGINVQSMLKPEYNVELLWTFYAMLPIGIDQNLPDDPENPDKLVFDPENIPLNRYIVQAFGNNLTAGNLELLRVQRNFYPHDNLPLYGSAHTPTLDDGAYSTAIGSILENHYIQLCKAMLQFLDNKDLANDPPAMVSTASPAMAHDINRRGHKIPVIGPNDVSWRQVPDATMTTPTFIQMIREQAQTSSKVVDAVLGKAMGSRTSASEAVNVFQTAMSGITTDVNMFSRDIYGGYATRVWDYSGRWIDPDVFAEITGSYGFAIKPEHFALRIGLRTDVGSTFIESLTRQQNYRYLLESTPPGDPTINRAYLYRELLREWKFKNIDLIVNDGGLEKQIQLSTEQAIQTYLGEMVMIDPDQDHNLAIRVKKSFLADRRSVWNTTQEYVVNGPKLVEQIQIHQLYLQLQMLQMQAQMQRTMLAEGGNDLLQPLQNPNPQGTTSPGGGAVAQQNGGVL